MIMEDVDLLSSENIDNPYPAYARLRENDPVHWSERLQGWLLTRADDVKQYLQDPRFSANRTHLFVKHQLRGLDPDDALRRVDDGLDRAVVAGLPDVRIIHGVGRGVLRDAIARALKSNPHVADARLGGHGEGGRGVTIVSLR